MSEPKNDRRPIVGWEGRYEITRAGEVWSVKDRQYVRKSVGKDGRACIEISIRGRTYQRDVDTAVREAFGKNV